MLAEVLKTSAPATLYHYTTQAGLLGIVGQKEIWATSAHFLNDAKEFKYALELLSKRIAQEHPKSKKLADLLERLELVREINVCVCSFCTKGDLLSQWRGYGQGGSGYSVGFTGSVLRKLATEQNFLLCPVIYKYEDQMALIDEVIEKWLGADHHFDGILPPLGRDADFEDYFSMIAPIIKHPSFAEEGEWRIISSPLDCDVDRFSFRAGRFSVIPYYRFPLESSGVRFKPKRIYVGPSPEQQLSVSGAELFLISHEVKGVPVQKSRIPYRSW